MFWVFFLSLYCRCQHSEKMYRCCECNKVLCYECYLKHDKEDHTFQSINDQQQLNDNLKVSTGIVDMKVVSGEILVIAPHDKQILETYKKNGDSWLRKEIEVGAKPCNIAVMDIDNNVVILLTNNYGKIAGIQKVDIKRRLVSKLERVNTMSPVDFHELRCPFSCIRDQLYFGVNSGIKVTNMSGEFRMKIDLDIAPRDIYYYAEAARIYCFDYSANKIISIDRDGHIINTFTNSSLKDPKSVTIDGKGNILILCKEEHNCFKVHRISKDGKSSEIIITLQQHTSYRYDQFASIFFHKEKDSIIIGLNSTVYFYNPK